MVYGCTVVAGTHLVLLGLVGGSRHGMAYGDAWRPPGKGSACCTRRMCWLYVIVG